MQEIGWQPVEFASIRSNDDNDLAAFSSVPRFPEFGLVGITKGDGVLKIDQRETAISDFPENPVVPEQFVRIGYNRLAGNTRYEWLQ